MRTSINTPNECDPMIRLQFLSALCASVFAVACAYVPHTFALDYVVTDNVYRLDHNLSASDCIKELRDADLPNLTCDRE